MDNQKFYNKLFNLDEILTDVSMICDGMDTISSSVDEKVFNTLSSGVFGLLAFTLNGVYREISELEADFHNTHDVKWPCQMTDEERRAWAYERGRFA